MNCVVRLIFFTLLGIAGGALACHANAQTSVSLDPLVTSGLSLPIDIAVPDDGSGRMFVAEQGGAVKVVDMSSGNVIATWLTIDVTASGEQGLLAIALDPNFGINPALPGYGDFYLAFTAPASAPKLGDQPDQVLRRYTVANPASNDASAAAWTDVLRIPDHYTNHNGADLHFGPDGYLYYSMGDGGSGGDPNNFAQNTGRKWVNGHSYYLLGKIMRIDVHHTTASASADMCAATPGQPAAYSIPAGNPFKGSSTECGEIWLWGLRNPFRFSFDRATGDLWIGDVGQAGWEEVNWLPAGSITSHQDRNLGWNLCEGTHYYAAAGSGSDCPVATNSVAPTFELSHNNGNCSVIGGYLYRGPVSALRGKYVFADWCTDDIWIGIHETGAWRRTPFGGGSGLQGIVAFGEDSIGNLYLVDRGAGRIYQFTGADVIFADGFDG